MKALFINQTGQLGGGELSMLEYLRFTTHSVEVVLFADGPLRFELESSGIKVHLLDIGRLAYIRRTDTVATLTKVAPELRAMRDALRRLAVGFDLVYANSQKAFIVCAFSLDRGVPLVWHLRDILNKEHFSLAVRKLAVLVGNRAASIIITNSKATKSAFTSSGGQAKKVVTVYNGINDDPFNRVLSDEVLRFRKSLGLHGVCLVGGFGRLTPWKGQHILIEALASLPQHTHALIVGEALFGEGAYAARLRQQAATLQVSNRVHFLGFRQDIPFLMHTVDIVAHTAIAPEPFGRVLVEGMLAERVVIATKAGGALEIIESDESGLLIEPNSPEALVRAITRVQSNQTWATQLARKGHLRAKERFSVSGMVSGIDTLLEEVIGQKKRSSEL